MNYLEEYFDKEFCDDLRKARFDEHFKKILYCLDGYDLYDGYQKIFDMSEYKIVGSIFQSFDFNNPTLNINKISNKKPTDVLLFVSTRLDYTDNVEDYIRKLTIENTNPYAKVEIAFCHSEAECEIAGLFFYREYTIDDISKIADKKQLISIAKYILEHPISINGIQNHFGIGFNRASNVITELERLEIISEKQNGKRDILIQDLDKIKYLINTYAFE